jgi:hypothetical protein
VKCLWVLGISILTILVGAPGALSASDQIVRSTGDLTGVVLTCPDENVVFNGSYTFVATERTKQIAPAGWVSTGTFTINLAGVTALGQTSGADYRVVGVTSGGFSFTFGTTEAASTSRLVLTWHLLPVAGGLPRSIHEVFLVIFDANQRLVAFVQQGPADCSA